MPFPQTRQITSGPGGRVLTNTRAWSPDGEWIVYDVRSDPAGEKFDGARIERVHVPSGRVEVLYESSNGACCGVAAFHPIEPKVVFILGPEHPSNDWRYNAWHRRGIIVDVRRPGRAVPLDARDITEPFTPGALRGGSHVHVWDAAGQWVSFTYEDHVLARFEEESAEHETNLRGVGVSVPGIPVVVSKDHTRNHDGSHFSVLVTRTVARPRPGSDDIDRAFEEAWVGANGYLRHDGSRQERALAFQGRVVTPGGGAISEVFLVDLPPDLTVPAEGPLAGTATRRPCPPRGVKQRRLTFTAACRYPGIQGPRHWLRSAPDGARIACLMKDDAGVVQLWTVSPNGGPARPLSHNPFDIASAFTWSPDGRLIAHAMDNSVCVTDALSGLTTRLTPRLPDPVAPRPEACVFSPDGQHIAWVAPVPRAGGASNQIFVTGLYV